MLPVDLKVFTAVYMTKQVHKHEQHMKYDTLVRLHIIFNTSLTEEIENAHRKFSVGLLKRRFILHFLKDKCSSIIKIPCIKVLIWIETFAQFFRFRNIKLVSIQYSVFEYIKETKLYWILPISRRNILSTICIYMLLEKTKKNLFWNI